MLKEGPLLLGMPDIADLKHHRFHVPAVS
jgi:hypothetical protein